MDWKKLVGSVAPLLGTALGGPFGGLAGKFIADKLGVSEAELPQAIEAADADTMIQIRAMDNEFKIKMEEVGLSKEQLNMEDRGSARDLAKSTSIYPQVIQSVLYDVAFIVIVYFLFTSEVTLSPTKENIIIYLMGILSAGLVQVNNFWFGSSSGSKEKNQLMRK